MNSDISKNLEESGHGLFLKSYIRFYIFVQQADSSNEHYLQSTHGKSSTTYTPNVCSVQCLTILNEDFAVLL
jgi:hypothetical protein